MMEHIMFSAEHVAGKKSGNPFKKHFALEDVNFELPAGYIMGIVGKNGAGKTTFFDYIMNEKKRYEGCFLLDGQDIHENHLWALDQIGFVSEANSFLERRTAIQNAEMLGRFYSHFDMDLFREILKMGELSGEKTIMTMSRGENMKFQLAFAVAHRPKLFLLDEATAGMDPVFRISFFRMLRRLLETEECSIIMSTHIEEEIEKQLDYVGLLENGRFVSFKENELV